MKKGIFVKIFAFALCLVLAFPFFASCGKNEKRDMTDKEIEKYFNVSSIGMSLISAPVKISYESRDEETSKKVDVIFAFQNAEFSGLSKKYDKPYTSTAVQVQIIVDGDEENASYISLFYDGLYFNSKFTDLYVAFDFEKLLAGFGLGTDDSDITDTKEIDDIFFGDTEASEGGKNDNDGWALKGYEDCFVGEKENGKWRVNVDLLAMLNVAMKQHKETLEPFFDLLKPYLPKGFDIKDLSTWRLPKMSAEFVFDKGGEFLDLKAKIELAGKSHFIDAGFLKTDKECVIKTDFDKSEYIDVVNGIFQSGSLDNLTNNLINVLTWLKNGNFSFDFNTTSVVTNNVKYKVAGRVNIETNLYSLIEDALKGSEYSESDETAEKDGGEKDKGGIDLSKFGDGLENGLTLSFVVNAVNLLKDILAKTDFIFTFDLIKYDENDKPLRELKGFKVKVLNGQVSPVDLNNGAVKVLDENDKHYGREFLYADRYEQFHGDLVKSIEAFLMFDFLDGYVQIVSELNSIKLEITESGLVKLVLNEGEKEEFFFEITAFDTVAPIK